jgi:hypothetical protein
MDSSHGKILICFSSLGSFTDSLATKHQTDVCSLTGRTMSSPAALNPYPHHYRMAFASSVLSPHTFISMPCG